MFFSSSNTTLAGSLYLSSLRTPPKSQHFNTTKSLFLFSPVTILCEDSVGSHPSGPACPLSTSCLLSSKLSCFSSLNRPRWGKAPHPSPFRVSRSPAHKLLVPSSPQHLHILMGLRGLQHSQLTLDHLLCTSSSGQSSHSTLWYVIICFLRVSAKSFTLTSFYITLCCSVTSPLAKSQSFHLGNLGPDTMVKSHWLNEGTNELMGVGDM